jgi:hypothetical protein
MRFLTLLISFLLITALLKTQPKTISYQGVLTDDTGTLITETLDIRFDIYSQESGGASIWNETHTSVSIANGLFNVQLGSVTPFGTLDFGQEIWLEITIDPSGTNAILSPRTAFNASGYALATSEPTYTIGLNSDLGGYVFYVTPDGKHGLVCETQDQGISSLYYAQDLITDPANHSTAGKNFTDWRMPTKYELNLMYTQRVAIGNFEAYYWSSTWSFDGVYGWWQDFRNGSQSVQNRRAVYYIRAVRAF